MIKATKKAADFEPVPAGNHVARLYQIIHIGTVATSYFGEERQRDLVRLTFELCNERKVFKEGDEPKPFSISREFTLSMGPKSALRPFVEGMGGVKLTDEEAYNLDLENLLGQECLLNVVHAQGSEGRVFANIQNATPLPKGMKAPAAFNEPTSIDINSTPWEEIEKLPDFIKQKMYSSEEYESRKLYDERVEAGDIPAKKDVKDFRPKAAKRVDEGEIQVDDLDGQPF
jgi:hypothetical protein